MSADNQQQNGSVAQSNGTIKTSISSSTCTTVSSTSSRSIANNSSFLYSSNSMLNREKARQVPPPTLPKYTSSFNAGTNGTLDKLNRDRETGGSYRLPSLDRLAMRQRIMDTDKPNGEATSVRTRVRSSF